MAVFKCKMCGGALEINNNETVAVCQYCGTKQTLPKLDDDRKANLYDRANHFRRNNEFDKAMGIYEQILNEDSTDAESYWSLVLCRYGIEYVEDPESQKIMPTVNRAQYTSVFDDEDYKSALQYADNQQKEIYELEADKINEIQKGILAISQNEEPFDVFICYKETDNSGRRTPDSALAAELYHELTREGFKVFFSRITLEDKLGQEYEPYIFAALNSAKVMVVVGTKPEHFNAVWVKNEWGRYLSLIKNGARKMLIPAYKNMDPYDLPEEFSHLQAQDMSKLGFMQDLIRVIKKINVDAQPIFKQEIVISEKEKEDNTSVILDRAFIHLETKEWAKANHLFEEALRINAHLSNAYLGKSMADLHITNKEDIVKKGKSVLKNKNFKLAIRFAEQSQKEILENVSSEIQNAIERRNLIIKKWVKKVSLICVIALLCISLVFGGIVGYEKIIDPMIKYNKAERLLKEGKYEEAIKAFASLKSYKDSEDRWREIKYSQAEQLLNEDKYEEAIKVFASLKSYKDSENRWKGIRYNQAVELYNSGEYGKSYFALLDACGYKDAAEKLNEISVDKLNRQIVAAHAWHTVALKRDGTVIAAGNLSSGKCKVTKWKDIVSVSAGLYHTVGLKKDGTVVATCDKGGGDACEVSQWNDIMAISAGEYHTVGLKVDGTVVAVGCNFNGRCNVSSWRDIMSISAGGALTVGLKKDGTVVSTMYIPELSGWSDIKKVSTDGDFVVGLKKDGSIVSAEVFKADSFNHYIYESVDFSKFTNLKEFIPFVGLKKDGTVVSNRSGNDGVYDCTTWTDIIAIAAHDNIVGVKSDGTVLSTIVNNVKGQCNVFAWTDVGYYKYE